VSLSPSQIERRLGGITATDISAVCGVNPYKSPITVFQEKRGEIPPSPDTEASLWGQRLEPLIRNDYETRHGVRVERVGTLAHPRFPWIIASPDGLVYPDGAINATKGLEIKTHVWRFAWMYGAPNTDEVPLWELLQCEWGMAVTGLERWDLCAFIDGKPTDYIIDRDDDLIAMMVERAERFRIDNIEGGEMPDPDGSKGFTDFLQSRWKETTAALVDITDDAETLALIQHAHEFHAAIAHAEDELEVAQQQLKLKIGDAPGITWKSIEHRKPQKITWKHNRDGTKVNHAAVVLEMRQRAQLALDGAGPALEDIRLCANDDGLAALAAIEATLSELASDIIEQDHTRVVTGARTFRWPYAWQRSKTKTTETATQPDNATEEN